MSSLSELQASSLLAFVSQRFPQLLFACYDRFPNAGAETQVEVFAVRCLPTRSRLDTRMGKDLRALVGAEVADADEEESGEVRLKFASEGVVEEAGGQGGATVLVRHYDVGEFARRLLRRRPRYVDILASEEAPLYASEDWSSLRTVVSASCCDGIRASKSYCLGCVGPAQGLLEVNGGASETLSASTVRALGGLCLRAAAGSDAADVEEFVERGETKREAWQVLTERLKKSALKAVKFDMPIEALEAWVDSIYEVDFSAFAAECVRAPPAEECCVPASVAEGSQLSAIPDIAAMGAEPVDHLAKAWPNGAVIAFMAQTGSFMYDLQVARSDRDYSIVFLSQPDRLAGRLPAPKTFLHKAKASFGDDKREEVEFEGKELASFVLELAKGNPNVVELLFTDKPHTSSNVFLDLRARRRGFLTCRCARQYLGFIGDRLGRASTALDAGGRFEEASGVKVSKWLYHAYHKIFEMRRILDGKEPNVALEGEERDFVLALRTKPLATIEDARALIGQGEQRRSELSARLDEVIAAGALPAEVDATALLAWLYKVRTAHTFSRCVSHDEELPDVAEARASRWRDAGHEGRVGSPRAPPLGGAGLSRCCPSPLEVPSGCGGREPDTGRISRAPEDTGGAFGRSAESDGEASRPETKKTKKK